MWYKTVVITIFTCTGLLYVDGDDSNEDQKCVCLESKKGQPFVVNAQCVDKQNIGDACFPNSCQIECDEKYPYRYLDGKCNNLKHRSWGMPNNTVVRLLPAVYSTDPNDPPGTPRRSVVDNTPLQSSRVISNTFFPNREAPSTRYTLVFMIMSQLFTHDVLSRKERLSPLDGCCNNGTRVPREKWHPNCLSIDISPQDEYYKKVGVGCFFMPRAQFSSDFGCNLPEIEQANDVTSFFDGSVVYGSDNYVADQLRLKIDGKLKFEETEDHRIFLPHSDLANIFCFAQTDQKGCFLASDFRANQHAQLAAMQVLLLRVHNKLCDELKTLNCKHDEWKKDETLYQEAKKILTAILQHSIFGPFSEALFGQDCAVSYGFSERDYEGYYKGYDEELNPGTTAEYQHVAWRAFHSLIEGDIKLYNDDRIEIGDFKLSKWVNNPNFIKKSGKLDSILIGMCTQAMQGFDRFYSPEVTEEFFKQVTKNAYGFDLVALDCERGRDCGVQPYIYYSTLAGYSVAKSFDDLKDRIDSKMIEKLEHVYQKVENIDALVGAILEKPYGEAMVGKTLLVVIAEQMRRYKFGDSFFYSFEGRGKFTPGQLNAIRSSSLSFLICYGSDGIKYMQKNAYVIPQPGELVECSKIVEDFLKQLKDNWVVK